MTFSLNATKLIVEERKRDFEKMSHFCKSQEGFRIIQEKIIIGITGVWMIFSLTQICYNRGRENETFITYIHCYQF